MNAYITLDGKQYKCLATTWRPASTKAVTVRKLLSGGNDIVYGPGVIHSWEGDLMVPHSGDGTWGDIEDLQATFDKTVNLAFVDHHGTSYTVTILGDLNRISHSPMWDASENEYLVRVTLVEQ